MGKIKISEVKKYVADNIGNFHEQRIERLTHLRLKTVLKKKNPYLFRAKNLQTGEQIVKALMDAFISSNEETMFGDWLEGLAIFICSKSYGGIKSGIQGIDLELEKDGYRYIVAIKSGPNWGNSSQIKKMKEDFRRAKIVLKTSQSRLQVAAINGCAYGIDNKPEKGDYTKLCGQEFWEFISGEPDLYTSIVEPIGFKAREKNEEFMKQYTRLVNRFTSEFLTDYQKSTGEIDWEKLVAFNSGKVVK